MERIENKEVERENKAIQSMNLNTKEEKWTGVEINSINKFQWDYW